MVGKDRWGQRQQAIIRWHVRQMISRHVGTRGGLWGGRGGGGEREERDNALAPCREQGLAHGSELTYGGVQTFEQRQSPFMSFHATPRHDARPVAQ